VENIVSQIKTWLGSPDSEFTALNSFSMALGSQNVFTINLDIHYNIIINQLIILLFLTNDIRRKKIASRNLARDFFL
jgi:hypothetical protein